MPAPLLTTEQLEAGLDEIRRSPADNGPVRLIVRRPEAWAREIVESGQLDTTVGLVGDNWLARGNRHRPDGSADPSAQVTIMNSRAVALVAQSEDRWALAGDQLYVDLDLSVTNLPAGSRLAIGGAIVEITATPHTGCRQFADRYGKDAVKFVNSPAGKALRLRGLNAKVVHSGTVRVGDVARKVASG